MGALPLRSEPVQFWRGLDRVVVLLCVTEVVSWGALYYSLPTAVGAIEADTGWSAIAITGCFSAGLVLSALVGILVGRLLDRVSPRAVMSTGSLVAAIGVVLLAFATSLTVFLLAWLVIGIAQAAVLYQPAFTVIGRHYGDGRDRPMLLLTLAGGLASTVFVPITAALLEVLDWRASYLVLGAVLAVVTIPLHLLMPSQPATPAGELQRREPAGRVIRTRRFVLLATGVTAVTFAAYAVTLNLIPLLADRGFSTGFAALAFALVGVGQVVGRIGLVVLNRYVLARYRPVVIGSTVALTLALFALIPGPAIILAIVALLAGAARGALTLVQATAVAERWGTVRLGSRNGAFGAPITAATALAPVGGVVTATWAGSYPAAVAVFAAIATLGAGCAYLADRRTTRRTQPAPATDHQPVVAVD